MFLFRARLGRIPRRHHLTKHAILRFSLFQHVRSVGKNQPFKYNKYISQESIRLVASKPALRNTPERRDASGPGLAQVWPWSGPVALRQVQVQVHGQGQGQVCSSGKYCLTHNILHTCHDRTACTCVRSSKHVNINN